MNDLNVLRELDTHPRAHSGLLSKVLGINRGSVSVILNKLRKRRLIEIAEGDTKIRRYLITEEGTATIAGVTVDTE